MGLTFVHVTHDQEEAMTMADSIAVMNRGRIEQLGAPTRALRAPAHRLRRRLPRRLEPAAGHRRRGRARCASHDGSEVAVAPDALDGRTGAVAVGIRPEKLQPRRVAGENRLAGARRRERLRRRLDAVRASTRRRAPSPSTSRTPSRAPTTSAPGAASSLSWSPGCDLRRRHHRGGARHDRDR